MWKRMSLCSYARNAGSNGSTRRQERKQSIKGNKMEKLDCFNEFNKVIDTIPIDSTFQPTEIKSRIEWQTHFKLQPHDATITRYIRKRRKLMGDLELASKRKSIYRRVERD